MRPARLMRPEILLNPEARRDLYPPTLAEILRRNRCLGCGHFVGYGYPVPYLKLCPGCVAEVAA